MVSNANGSGPTTNGKTKESPLNRAEEVKDVSAGKQLSFTHRNKPNA